MKANRITTYICMGIAIIAFIFMIFSSNQTNFKLLYDTSLALFGSAMLASVVAYLAYINQLRDAKIDLFSELLSGYREYAKFYNGLSSGTFDIEKTYLEASSSLTRFFNKYSIYSALLGSSAGIVDQFVEAAKLLNMLNGSAVLLTKLSPASEEFFNQRKAIVEDLSMLEETLVNIGRKIIAKTFGIDSTYNIAV